MIDLQSVYIRGFLRDVQARVQTTTDALSWYEGDPEYISDQLLPPFTEGSNAAEDFVRFAKQVQNMGPMALRLRRQAAIGSITWSDARLAAAQDASDAEKAAAKAAADELDARLEAMPRARWAQAVAKGLLVNGVTAVWPVLRGGALPDPDDGQPVDARGELPPTLQVLGGHLEPLWDPDDVGGTPVGLMQVLGNVDTYLGRGIRYDIRVWDFTTGTLRVWRNRLQPWDLGAIRDDDPDGGEFTQYPQEGQGALAMPTIVWADVDQYGLPIGEGRSNMPTLRQIVAQDMRVLRTSQSHAFPVWALSGKWEAVSRIGANTVLRARDGDATAQRISSGDLGPLFDERQAILERFRQALALPITGAGDAPSGEAYTQANVAYATASDDLAGLVSDALTAGVRGLLSLQDGSATPLPAYDGLRVTVMPDRELKRTVISMQVREDFRVGAVSRRMAWGELEQFYPNTTTEEVERWLALDEQPLPPAPPEGPAATAALADTSLDDDLAADG